MLEVFMIGRRFYCKTELEHCVAGCLRSLCKAGIVLDTPTLFKCVCVLVDIHTYAVPEVNIKCLPMSLSTLFARDSLALSLELTDVVREVGEQIQTILLCHLPGTGILGKH